MQEILLLCSSNTDSSTGHHIITTHNDTRSDHIIDLDAQPYIPEGWSIRPEDQIVSRARGMWRFNPTAVSLYLADEQRGEGFINGNQLSRKLVNFFVLPANVLDYLLAHKELIPEYWKQDENRKIRCIFFWGTIYCSAAGSLSVRFLYFVDGEWNRSFSWLDSYLSSYCSSALLAV